MCIDTTPSLVTSRGQILEISFCRFHFLIFLKKWSKYEEKNPAYDSESCTSVITSIVVGGPTLALSASMLQAGRDDMIIKYLNVNSQTSCKDQVISPSNYNVLKMSNIQLDLFFI
jgi:hypothetical protein